MMPYIPPEERPQYESVVNAVRDALSMPGHVNYILFAATKRYIKMYGRSYRRLRDVRAELRECQDEIKRRLLDEYEDSKILENGDVE